MTTNPLKQVANLGQSIWLDYIQRDLMKSGKLKKLIEEDGLQGMTSNPSLFEQAITKSKDYDQDIANLSRQGKNAQQICDLLTQKDVQDAADAFYPYFNEVNGKEGYVSLEVNPHLTHDTQGTIEEARRLWQALDRPNVYIKIPGTKEGLVAIEQLISEGININVTLLFGLTRYREVAQAYIAGLKTRLEKGLPIDKIKSVASFFLSRIDVLVDPLLAKCAHEKPEHAELAKKLQGQVAIISAQIAYQIYKELFQSQEFQQLRKKGANPQRLLWASTGTKNPEYSDVKYIEALIGEETVNTVPLETLDAYRDHGKPKIRLEDDIETATLNFNRLPELGIMLDDITQILEDEGGDKFNQAYDQLIQTIENRI